MNKTMKRIIVPALLALLFSFGCATQKKSQPATAPAAITTQPLFIIERSKNANVVHYDAQLAADGKLDTKEPVIVYWILLAQGGRRMELDWIQKMMAYGINLKLDPSANGCQMTIVAAPDQPIAVKKVGGVFRAEVIIAGRPAFLDKIYIDASDDPTDVTVHYLELHGKDVSTGKQCFEKITPD